MANIDELPDDLNSIIMELNNISDYNNNVEQMHQLLTQISENIQQHGVGYLDNQGLSPEIIEIYTNLPNPITYDNQVSVIHNLWLLLHNEEAEVHYESDDEDIFHPNPNDFFLPILADQINGTGNKNNKRKNRRGKKSKRRQRQTSKSKKGKKSKRRGRGSGSRSR